MEIRMAEPTEAKVWTKYEPRPFLVMWPNKKGLHVLQETSTRMLRTFCSITEAGYSICPLKENDKQMQYAYVTEYYTATKQMSNS